MSGRRGHQPDPDRAALAELLRAFADVPATSDETAHDREADEPDFDRVTDRDDIDQDDIDQDDAADFDVDGDLVAEHDELEHDQLEHDLDATAPSTGPIPQTSPVRDPLVHDPIVIALDDDDLPDPVYIEGNLDRDGGRPIVFIEDDPTGDTIGTDGDRNLRRGIEPRMRERRVAVKRAESRKRLKWVLLIGTIVVIGVGGLAVLGSPLFAIRADQVSVTGDVYTDAERLQSVIDELVGTPVLVADTQAAERELEAIPWVDDAVVRTNFPHAVTIELREREAMTTYAGPDSKFRVLDREGRVLDVLDKYPFAYLLLGGPDPVDLDPGEFAPTGYAAASELAKNLTGSVRGRIKIVEVTADGSRLVMQLDDGTEVRFGEARDLFAKLVRLETVLSSPEPREPGVIDVSTKEVTL
jgi:cell division protein FtsQ